MRTFWEFIEDYGNLWGNPPPMPDPPVEPIIASTPKKPQSRNSEAAIRKRLEKSHKFQFSDGEPDYKKINWYIGVLKRKGEVA